jgi:hypothetical protein
MTNQRLILSPRIIAQIVFFVGFTPLLPLLIAWRWDWWEAWVYALGTILSTSKKVSWSVKWWQEGSHEADPLATVDRPATA